MTELCIVLIAVSGFLGCLVGGLLANRKERQRSIGTLRLDQSDPAEPPYLFLELDPDGVQKIHRNKSVVLRVRIENYLSKN